MRAPGARAARREVRKRRKLAVSDERMMLPGFPVVPGYSLRANNVSEARSRKDEEGNTPVEVHTVEVELVDHLENVGDEHLAVRRVLDGVREEGRASPAADRDEDLGVVAVRVTNDLPKGRLRVPLSEFEIERRSGECEGCEVERKRGTEERRERNAPKLMTSNIL